LTLLLIALALGVSAQSTYSFRIFNANPFFGATVSIFACGGGLAGCYSTSPQCNFTVSYGDISSVCTLQNSSALVYANGTLVSGFPQSVTAVSQPQSQVYALIETNITSSFYLVSATTLPSLSAGQIGVRFVNLLNSTASGSNLTIISSSPISTPSLVSPNSGTYAAISPSATNVSIFIDSVSYGNYSVPSFFNSTGPSSYDVYTIYLYGVPSGSSFNSTIVLDANLSPVTTTAATTAGLATTSVATTSHTSGSTFLAASIALICACLISLIIQ